MKKETVDKLLENKYIKDYGRLIFLGVVGIVALSAVLLGHHFSPKPIPAAKPVSISAPKVAAVPDTPTPVVATTPVVTAPPTSPTTSTRIAAPPDNTAQCNSLVSQKQADLDSLNSQIVQQLQIIKSIIGSSTIDNEILQFGGNPNEVVSQSGITESFNQASTQASSLISQLSADKSSYDDQLIGLSCTDWTP